MALLTETYEETTFRNFKSELASRFGEENLPADLTIYNWFKDVWEYAQKSLAVKINDDVNKKYDSKVKIEIEF